MNMERVKTVLAALFLLGFAALFLFAGSKAVLGCLFRIGRCNDSDLEISGAILGFAVLGIVIFVGNKFRR